MSSSLDASGTRDPGPLSARPLPKLPVSPPTRKPPPSPLALPTSSPSHLPIPRPNPAAASASPDARNSLVSSFSDMTSGRSDITSLHCSEFPAPPSALPPIPASPPQTPGSLYFSTSPATPQSRSPRSEFTLLVQDPPEESPSGSPSSLKGIPPNSRVQSPQTSKFARQQLQPRDTESPNTGGNNKQSKLGNDKSSAPMPTRYSQFAMYKESTLEARALHPPTPTTAGTLTPKEWPSSSDRSSPMEPPRPAYIRENGQSRPSSPLRHGLSASPSSHNLSSSPASPPSVSSQPPQVPLPVPPSQRSSSRGSARYSHIARKVGVMDMGMDISEEQLLSTNFITELLKQPVASSPRSGRSLRHMDSRRSQAVSTRSDDTHGLNKHIRGSEIRLGTEHSTDLASPGLAPTSVSFIESDLTSPSRDSHGRRAPDPPPLPPLNKHGTHFPLTHRIPSGPPPSSVPREELALTDQPPSPSISLDSLTQALPVQTLRSHGTPHPLVPSSPMSAIASPPAFPGSFAQAQSKHLPGWRKSSTSRPVTSRLPIGPPSPGGTSGARAVVNPIIARIGSPKVRQHRYPRQSMMKRDSEYANQKTDDPLSPSALSPISPILLSVDTKAQEQPKPVAQQSESSTKAKPTARNATLSNPPSPVSASSSTRTQRESLTGFTGKHGSSDVRARPDGQTSTKLRVSSHHSYDSTFLSSDSAYDESGYEIEGQVQTASRLLDAAVPVPAKSPGASGPTVVGTATAVLVRHQSGRHHENPHASEQYLDATGPTSGLEPKTPAPPSPRQAPSVHSPPSHRPDIPESAKSVLFSDDTHESMPPALPHTEVVGSSTHVFWDTYQNASLAGQAQGGSPKRQISDNAASFKSVVSYLTNRSRASTVASNVSKGSSKAKRTGDSSRWTWLRRKPLPPLPPPSPSAIGFGDAVNAEAKLQHPDSKAGADGPLSLLESGPYQRSKVSLLPPGQPQGWNDVEKWSPRHMEDHPFGTPGTTLVTSSDFGEDPLNPTRNKYGGRRNLLNQKELPNYGLQDFQYRRRKRQFSPGYVHFWVQSNPRRCFWLSLLGIVIVIVIFGATFGTALRRSHRPSALLGCGGNKTGALCNIDATCICPLSLPGTTGCSAPLAQALNDLAPKASQLFMTNITSEALALVLYRSQGTPVTSNCTSQAELVDVGSVLDSNTSPNRTAWAQAALLWNLFQSGDIEATQVMRSAIERLPFKSLLSKDGIEADPSGQFVVFSLGYIFNFANQTVNPPSLTFKVDGHPSAQQLAHVNSFVESSLDRMYSFANASSTQRQEALTTYWRSVLSLNLNDLPNFLAAFTSAPILLPFDATSAPGGQAISGLLTSAVNRSLSFPPPVACFPALNSSQLSRINSIETPVFGLPALTSSAAEFDSTCFANHPVYGVLDVLRTRLPFSDSRTGVAKQAVALGHDASSRVVLHVGELLSALPGPPISDLSAFDADPRQFGTLSNVNHIALQWLQSFPNTSLATEAAKFVVSSPSTPPSDSVLRNSTSLPIVEVALFGTVFLSDLSSFVSSFSTSSGGLFFGTSQGQAFRRWALQQPSSLATIAWTDGEFAPTVVHEGTSTNSLFEDIWTLAGTLATGQTNSSAVERIVGDLDSAGLFSP